jgi:hypothetical protein
MVTLKRYPTYRRNGLGWSDWFVFNGKEREKWQVKNKHKNEYWDVTEEEWKDIQKKQDEERLKRYS